MSVSTIIRSKRKSPDDGAERLYPINQAAHTILLNAYKDNPVIPKAVIELLKDYNPFSYRTGLSKKQVIKYLRLLLVETPHLADYLVSCLPDAQDLLSPHLLEKIPKDEQNPNDSRESKTSEQTKLINHAGFNNTNKTSKFNVTELIGDSYEDGTLSQSRLQNAQMTPLEMINNLPAGWDADNCINEYSAAGSVAGQPSDDQPITTGNMLADGKTFNMPNALLCQPDFSFYLPVLASLYEKSDRRSYEQDSLYASSPGAPYTLNKSVSTEITGLQDKYSLVSENLLLSKSSFPYHFSEAYDKHTVDSPSYGSSDYFSNESIHGVFPDQQVIGMTTSNYSTSSSSLSTTPSISSSYQKFPYIQNLTDNQPSIEHRPIPRISGVIIPKPIRSCSMPGQVILPPARTTLENH